MSIQRNIFPVLISFIFIGSAAAQPTPISASVEMYKGRPSIMLNGKPQTPVIYALTDVPGGRWPWEELPRHTMETFCAANIHLMQVDLFFDHVWREDGSINLDTARRLLRSVLDICPDAAIFLRFHVNPPKWWQAKHPEENTLYADTTGQIYHPTGLHRLIQDDEHTAIRYSLASEKWQTEASSKLAAFLQALQALPEANALIAIQVAGGVFGEWHYWGFLENEPDMNPAMLRYFRAWLKQKYVTDKKLQTAWEKPGARLDSASLPDMKERTTSAQGIFRDPAHERKIIDYYEAQHNLVAEDIIRFCRVVKENWPRPIITGSFYGYFYSVFGREAAGGHLAVEKVLQSPYVDFLCGPHAYYPDPGAEPGDPYRSRSLINSVSIHHKLWLDEMDVRPPLVPNSDSAFDLSLRKSVAITRQNMLFTYSKGMGLWFYDFGPSGMDVGTRTKDHGNWGWWDEPTLMKDIANVKALMDSNLEVPYTTDADVLVVHDTKTFYYTSSTKSGNRLEHWANNWLPIAIFHSGVVHDVIHLDDLGKVDLARYKAVVFINDWVLTAEEKGLISKKVSGAGRHLVFVYAPGYSDEKKLNINNIASVTGMKLARIYPHLPVSLTPDKSISGAGSSPGNAQTGDPLFAIVDSAAVPLAWYSDTTLVALARKSFPDHTSWYMTLPAADPAIWRYILQQAGAHVYDETGDIFYEGHGILSVDTRKGGARTIVLKNGKKIQINLPAMSTTLLKPETGEVLLK